MNVSDEMNRRIVAAVPEGIWVVDPEGRTIFSNRRMAEILRVPFESMPEQSCFACVFPEELEDAQRHFARTMAGDRRPFDFRLRRADGSPVWVSISCMPMPDDSGAQIGLLGLFSDISERKKAEAALRESEERFRSFIDTAPVMVWVSGPDKIRTFFNKPWLDFTGRSMEQELGSGWASGVHPEDLDRCLAIYSSAFDARSKFQMEYRLRRADGEFRWILDNGIPFYHEGEFAGYISSCVDVTERRLIEEQLRANEARLTDAQRLAKVGSWERDIKPDTMRWSNEMFRIFGLPVESTPTFTELLPYIHPEDREKLVETDKKLCSGIGPGEVEYRIIRPDGEVRFIRATAEVIKDHRGAPTRIAGATQDITEQVEAREFLRRSEARLKSAERLTHVGNWHWDIKANRVSWSDELFKIFGQPENSTPSYEAFLEAIIPQDRDRVAGEVRDYLAKKRGYSMEFRISRPDGELRTIACISEVGLDQEGLPTQMFGACHDITDFRRAQEEIIAGQKLETIGTLTNGIAHDFNNILGGVLAQAELALDELAAGSPPEEELKAIQGGAIRGAEIVRELMIYAGKDNGVLGPVDVSQIVEEMIQLLNVSVPKHATLETSLGRDLPNVRATVAQVSQIVMNVVTNASEALEGKQGFITVTTERAHLGPESKANHLASLPDGDYIRLKVSDTGRGMDIGIRSKIFDPFFTTKTVGRGLGLSVVHGIVRRLGGAIDVASKSGKGTTFEILLPCETTAGRGHGPMSGPEEPARPSEVVTILFVEDEEAIRRAASKILRNAGFSVIEARDGSAALDEIQSLKRVIDVLFLDVTLPGTPSREVLVEAGRLRPEMKVIVTSAHSEDTAADLLNARFKHFIRKPYRLGDLADLIRQTLL